MSKFILQLGRNTQLSLLEIASVLGQNNIITTSLVDQFLVLEVESSSEITQKLKLLAGIIKVSEVIYETEFLNEGLFDKLDFYYPKNFNLFFSSNAPKILGELTDLGHKFCNRNKLKGQIISINEDYFRPASYIEKDSEKNSEFQIIAGNNNYLIGKVIHYSESDEFRKMDLDRPDKKITHGTSFRIARIMMNILDPKPGETIVDPFCGTGTFLLEAFKRNCNVVGIDNAQHLIQIARKNIEWFQNEHKLSSLKYKLICESSATAVFVADHVIFEPYMGDFLSELPSFKRAKDTATTLHGLYTKVLKNMYANTSNNSKMVCVIPFFKTKENTTVSIPSDLFTQAGYKLIKFNKIDDILIENPTEYSAHDGSFIGRKIYLLEKINGKIN
jgi:tRNA G10  N-methylase Trm11